MELGPSTLVGVGLALIGLILYLVKTKKPDLSRDYDLFLFSRFIVWGNFNFPRLAIRSYFITMSNFIKCHSHFFIGESLWLRGLKSQNRNFFPTKYSMEKKTVFSTLELPSFGVERSHHSFSSEDFSNKQVYLSEYNNENLTLSKDKTVIPFEIQKTKDIFKTNHHSGLFWKKKPYEEKKYQYMID